MSSNFAPRKSAFITRSTRLLDLKAGEGGLGQRNSTSAIRYSLYKAVNRRGKIHYRLFNQFGDQQVTLLTTSPP